MNLPLCVDLLAQAKLSEPIAAPREYLSEILLLHRLHILTLLRSTPLNLLCDQAHFLRSRDGLCERLLCHCLSLLTFMSRMLMHYFIHL